MNTVGKSAFVEAVGQPSDDASGYLDFFKGEIKTHLAQECGKSQLTEDNGKWRSRKSGRPNDKIQWGVKIEQTKTASAGIGLWRYQRVRCRTGCD
ncbi:hypothetical protein EWT52_27070 [Escherichia coli O25b:H4]|nr:hypothetical protein EWT52_27070 [Escherichia coli O25b:H4]